MKYRIYVWDEDYYLKDAHECANKREAQKKLDEVRAETPWYWHIEVMRKKWGNTILDCRGLKERLSWAKPSEVKIP